MALVNFCGRVYLYACRFGWWRDTDAVVAVLVLITEAGGSRRTMLLYGALPPFKVVVYFVTADQVLLTRQRPQVGEVRAWQLKNVVPRN